MQKLLGDDRIPLAMLALMFVLAAANWPFLPDRLPMHWSSTDAGATPDSYADKAFALLFLPVFAAIQYGILRAVSKPAARVRLALRSDGDAEDGRDWFWACTVTLLTAILLVIYGDMLIAFRGHRMHTGAVLGLFLLALAPLFPHLERNPVIGVRTPWTLKSDYVWKRTHRVAARWTYVFGPVLIGADVLGPGLGPTAIVGGLLVWAGALTAYSWVQWRNDPDRARTAGGGER